MSGWLTSTAGKLLKFLARAGHRNSKHPPEPNPVSPAVSDSFSVGIHFEALEPRILLSGSGEAGVADNALQNSHSVSQNAIEMESFRFHEASYGTATDSLTATTMHEEASGQTSDSVSTSTPDALHQGPSTKDISTPGESSGATVPPSNNELLPNDVTEDNIDTLSALDATKQDIYESDARRELIIIDAGVTNYQPLVEDLLANSDESREMEVFVLDRERDGISQISDVLAEYQDLDAVHIVSHGTDRAVKLGSTWVYGDKLDSHAAEISGWKDSLADGADLLFYGCDLTAGDEGRALLATFGSLTGADVAASVNDTGHSIYFGDWVLEYGSDSIETEIAFSNDVQQNWFNLMAVLTVSTNSDTVDAPNPATMTVDDLIASPGPDTFISLREAILAANNTVGADDIILPGGPSYTLTKTGAGEDAADTGDLDITDDLTIIRDGAATTTIDGNASDRVLHILSGATVKISGITITNGDSPDYGGGLYNDGDLTLIDSQITGSSALEGGGLYNLGAAELNRVTISGNDAEVGGDLH